MSDSDSPSNDQSSQTIVAGQATPPPGDVDYVALKPGQTIGRYEIVAVLGQGGFGITYRARDVQLGREVAIKEYLPSALAIRQDSITVLPRTTKMADDFGWGRERFVTEGRTLASLHRVPAIVQVFDFLEANGTAYIVMELLHGQTLEDRIASNGKLGPEEVDRILWPLLDGLEQVHSAGFLHRDIKPANILLDAGGNPTLIDFGASRAAMAGRSTALTAIFTPGYAAAEQMTSAKQGPWTDIYGLSATLYHAIAGRVPPSAFDRMLDDACEPLARIKPAGFKPGVLAGIDAGLSVAARERPQSIAGWRPILAMTAAPTGESTVVLGKASETTPGARPEPGPAAKSEGRHVPILAGSQGDAAAPPRRTGLWVAIAAVVLILLGGGGYVAFVPRGPDPAVLEAKRLAEEAAARQKQAEEEAARQRAENEKRQKAEQEAAEKAEKDRIKAEQDAAERRQKAAQEDAERRQKAEQDRVKAEQEAVEQRRLKAEQDAAEQQRRAVAEEEQRKRFEAEARLKIAAEMAAQKRAEEEARRKAEEEAEARRKAVEDARKAVEFVAGAFDHFGKSLMLIGLKDRSDEVRLQGVDIVADPDLHQLAVKALAAKPRHLRCRQTDRLTDGTPLYRCLITPLTAKEPLADVPDAERDDLALALVRNGLVLASCDAPRSYADMEDDARSGKKSLWGRVSVPDYKKRCSK